MISIILTIILMLIPIFFIMGTPIFAIVGGVVTIVFYNTGESLALVAQNLFKLAMMPSLFALPLFIFAGYFLSESSFAERLLKLFESMTGWMKGGVCLSAIISTDIFTALTGASAITIVAFGGLIVPMLIKKGYSEKFSEGLLTISGGSGALFPPCVAVIIYGIISRTNIQWLYIAGLIPAIIFILAQFVYSVYVSYKEDIPTTPFKFKELFTAMNDLKWELPLIVSIMTGIMFGFTTIEEAATISVIGFIIIECFIRKEVKLAKIPKTMVDSMMILGALFLIMGCALALTHYMIMEQVPQKTLEAMQGIITSKISFLMCLNIFLLVVGMTMDMFSAILVMVPLISPIATSYGIDPLHLGVVFFLNMEIGFITPPFGQSLFVSSLRFNVPILRIFRGVIPFAIMEMIALVIITYYENISLWLIKFLDLQPTFNIHMM